MVPHHWIPKFLLRELCVCNGTDFPCDEIRQNKSTKSIFSVILNAVENRDGNIRKYMLLDLS